MFTQQNASKIPISTVFTYEAQREVKGVYDFLVRAFLVFFLRVEKDEEG